MSTAKHSAPVLDAAYPDVEPQPNSRGQQQPAAASGTSWGALSAAFFAGGFACFVVMGLVVLICVVAITTLGHNANATFSTVGTQAGGTGSSQANPRFSPSDNNTFQKVSTKIEPKDGSKTGGGDNDPWGNVPSRDKDKE
jgi:hypothetical protein